MIRRVFGVDPTQCDCGGRYRLVATIRDPRAAAAILRWLAMRADAEPVTPARPPPDPDLAHEDDQPAEAGQGELTAASDVAFGSTGRHDQCSTPSEPKHDLTDPPRPAGAGGAPVRPHDGERGIPPRDTPLAHRDSPIHRGRSPEKTTACLSPHRTATLTEEQNVDHAPYPLSSFGVVPRPSVSGRQDCDGVRHAQRQQLAIFKRRGKPPRLAKADRAFWVFLSRAWVGWKDVLVIVNCAVR